MKKNITFFYCLTLLLLQTAISQPGRLDVSFNNTGRVSTDFGNSDEEAFATLVQPDGKVVVVGYSVCCTNAEDFALIRYNTDGTLDNTFGGDGKVTTDFLTSTEIAECAALQTDGKIVAAGFEFNGVINMYALARYNDDGSLDNTFGNGGRVTTNIGSGDCVIKSIVIQHDGKIIAAGAVSVGANSDFALARYNTNGTLDNTYGVNGVAWANLTGKNFINALALQADERVIALGIARNTSFRDSIAMMRFTTSGTIDSTFGTNGRTVTFIGIDASPNAITLQSDGKIVIAGGMTSLDNEGKFCVGRFDTAGVADFSFGINGFVNTSFRTPHGCFATGVAIQEDGKIIATGTVSDSFLTTLSNNNFALARYNTNGILDYAFGTNGIDSTDFGTTVLAIYNDYGNCSALTPDGKLVVAGTTRANFGAARYLLDNGTGVKEHSEHQSLLSIYPNPPKNMFTVELPQRTFDVSVYDIAGRKVFERKNVYGITTIDGNTYANGIYFVHTLTDKQEIYTRKIVIAK